MKAQWNELDGAERKIGRHRHHKLLVKNRAACVGTTPHGSSPAARPLRSTCSKICSTTRSPLPTPRARRRVASAQLERRVAEETAAIATARARQLQHALDQAIEQLSWIHVEDAAAAAVAAVEHGARGIYNIVDDEPAPVATWLPYLAEIAGAKRPWRIPVWLGRLLAGDVGVALMTQIRGSSNAKAKRELGWRPSFASWRDGFRTIVAADTAERARWQPAPSV